jgi:hypothetical protein
MTTPDDRAHASDDRVLVGVALALGAVVLLRQLTTPTLMTPDSPSYLAHSLWRTPVYPLFLDVMKVFGGGAMKAAQVVQNLLVVAAAFVLSRAMSAALRCARATSVVALVLLVVPSFRAGNVIGTEAIAYAGFLAFLSSLLVFLRQPQRVLALGGWSLVLLMTRPQFLFVMPILAAAVAFAWWKAGRAYGLRAALVLGAVVPLGSVVQATNNLVYHGHFMRVPFTGEQLLATTLYCATPGDEAGFSDEDRRTIEPVLHALVEKKQLDGLRTDAQSRIDHFNLGYNPTLQMVQTAWLGGREMSSMQPDEWLRFDHDTMRMARVLARRHGKAIVMFLAKELQEVEGQLLVVILLAGALSLWRFWADRDGATLFLFAIAALCACNWAVILLVEPLAARYLLYTDSVFPPLLIVWMDGQLRRSRA